VGRIALCAHHERAEAGPLVDELAAWAAAAGHEAWLLAADAAALGRHELASDRPIGGADLVVALGGDGTMLRAVGVLAGAPVPLLGVNLGHLGYLTEVDPVDAVTSVERFMSGPERGGWHLDERMLVLVEVAHSDDGTQRWRALNEAVVEKMAAGHTVRLLASIDGAPFTSYAADGLIVATPTGSTAYSLSARGPIVSPRHRALLLTPVSPHMLFDRTLVLDPSEVVDIEVVDHQPAELAIDGQVVTVLAPGDVVRCRSAAETARFVRFGPHHYHQILKTKFGLLDR